MSRKTEEWIGKTDDSRPPTTVQIRLFEAARGRCQKCATVLTPGRWHLDHKIRLKDGEGNNRERNLQVLCELCHREKTGAENKSQAKANRVKARTYGIKKVKKGPPMPGTRASKWKQKVNKTWVRRDDE